MTDPSIDRVPAEPGPTGRSSARPVRAAIVTVDPLLVDYLTGLHPDLAAGLLTRLPGTSEGILRDTDALLVLTAEHDHSMGGRAMTVYLGTDLDDASVWERAVKLRAEHVAFLPDPAAEARILGWITGTRSRRE